MKGDTLRVDDPYRASPTNLRKRLNHSQVKQLEAQILDVLEADNPQSVRHVFYRLTDPRLEVPIEKSERGYKQVQQRLVKMRRSGMLPYNWISDATRRGFHVNTFGGGGDLISAFAGLYRANLWAECQHHIEVWCESRSIAGVIQPLCGELAVSLYPSAGFSSMTLIFESALAIQSEIDHYGKEGAVVIYIGDYDPAGVLIDQAIERGLREHLNADVPLTVHRIGINEAQIAEYDLPTKPRKVGDRRRLDIRETVEAEAMPAAVLRGLLRAKVESYLPARALEIARAAERSEQAGLRLLAGNVKALGLEEANEILWKG